MNENLSRICCDRTIVTSTGVGNLDDIEGGSVKHVRHYQVYRGMSPTTSSRLEVGLLLYINLTYLLISSETFVPKTVKFCNYTHLQQYNFSERSSSTTINYN